MKKIVLIGFAACYKSTVGKLLADRLNFAFVDTDEEIARIENMSIRQIFETQGESYFRQRETDVLCAIQTYNTVVACGGGSVLSSTFSEFIRDSIVICLTATAETVLARLGEVERPLFDGLTVEQLRGIICERAPLYNKYADAVFNTDGKTSQQVFEQIYRYLTANNFN